MILAKIQADSVEDSLLFYSCQSLDGEGDFVSLAIRFAILCVHIIIITIIITRPKPTYSRQGLAGSSLRASGVWLGHRKWEVMVFGDKQKYTSS